MELLPKDECLICDNFIPYPARSCKMKLCDKTCSFILRLKPDKEKQKQQLIKGKDVSRCS